MSNNCHLSGSIFCYSAGPQAHCRGRIIFIYYACLFQMYFLLHTIYVIVLVYHSRLRKRKTKINATKMIFTHLLFSWTLHILI